MARGAEPSSTHPSSPGGAAETASSPAVSPAVRARRKELTYAMLPDGRVDAVRVWWAGAGTPSQVEVRHRDGSFAPVDPDSVPAYVDGVERYKALKASNPRKAAEVAGRAGGQDRVRVGGEQALSEAPEEPESTEESDNRNDAPEGQERDSDETSRDVGETPLEDVAQKPKGKRGGVLV